MTRKQEHSGKRRQLPLLVHSANNDGSGDNVAMLPPTAPAAAAERHNCDLCDFTAHNAESVVRHRRRIHERIKFWCDKCDFSSSQAAELKDHIESRHLGGWMVG